MDNKAVILDRALHLFSARGYEAVGVQEIVESAGVTKPTLYHYFGSKKGLLDAVLREHFGDLNRRMREATVYSGDLPLTLTRIAATCFAFARERPTFYSLHLSLWFAPPESEASGVVASFAEEMYRLVEAVFVQAVNNHGNMRGRHRQYATSLLGVINTYVGMSLNGYVDLTDELVHQVVRQFSHGIYS